MAKGIFLKGVRSDGTVDKDRTFEYVFRDETGAICLDEESGEPVTATLRFVTRTKQRAMRKEHTKRSTASGQMVEQFDVEQFTADLVDYMIVDWRHVRADDGEEAPCTRETKLGLTDDQLIDMQKLAVQGQSPGDGFRRLANVSRLVG